MQKVPTVCRRWKRYETKGRQLFTNSWYIITFFPSLITNFTNVITFFPSHITNFTYVITINGNGFTKELVTQTAVNGCNSCKSNGIAGQLHRNIRKPDRFFWKAIRIFYRAIKFFWKAISFSWKADRIVGSVGRKKADGVGFFKPEHTKKPRLFVNRTALALERIKESAT